MGDMGVMVRGWGWSGGRWVGIGGSHPGVAWSAGMPGAVEQAGHPSRPPTAGAGLREGRQRDARGRRRSIASPPLGAARSGRTAREGRTGELMESKTGPGDAAAAHPYPLLEAAMLIESLRETCELCGAEWPTYIKVGEAYMRNDEGRRAHICKASNTPPDATRNGKEER